MCRLCLRSPPNPSTGGGFSSARIHTPHTLFTSSPHPSSLLRSGATQHPCPMPPTPLGCVSFQNLPEPPPTPHCTQVTRPRQRSLAHSFLSAPANPDRRSKYTPGHQHPGLALTLPVGATAPEGSRGDPAALTPSSSLGSGTPPKPAHCPAAKLRSSMGHSWQGRQRPPWWDSRVLGSISAAHQAPPGTPPGAARAHDLWAVPAPI